MRQRLGQTVTGFRVQFDIELRMSVSHRDVDALVERSEMNRLGGTLIQPESAIEVPIVDALRKRPTPLALDVATHIVLAGLDQPVPIFALDLKVVSFPHENFRLCFEASLIGTDRYRAIAFGVIRGSTGTIRVNLNARADQTRRELHTSGILQLEEVQTGNSACPGVAGDRAAPSRGRPDSVQRLNRTER